MPTMSDLSLASRCEAPEPPEHLTRLGRDAANYVFRPPARHGTSQTCADRSIGGPRVGVHLRDFVVRHRRGLTAVFSARVSIVGRGRCAPALAIRDRRCCVWCVPTKPTGRVGAGGMRGHRRRVSCSLGASVSGAALPPGPSSQWIFRGGNISVHLCFGCCVGHSQRSAAFANTIKVGSVWNTSPD